MNTNAYDPVMRVSTHCKATFFSLCCNSNRIDQCVYDL